MKKNFKPAIIFIIIACAVVVAAIVAIIAIRSDSSDSDSDSVLSDAVYSEDAELGSGSKSFTLDVVVLDSTVHFTIHTDKTTVGDALTELNLIEGDQGDFGLYVKKVNGITADYDIDQSYWTFYINGEMAMSGVDMTDIEEGSVYRLEYTK